MSGVERFERVRAVAAAHGLQACGVCAFDTAARPLLPCRAASRLPAGAETVIVVLFPYAVDSDLPRNLSRYACVPDYHRAAGAVLTQFSAALADAFTGERFEPFIDNSPLPEVACAVAAGLGVRGDNGLLIHERYGSYVFIGCVVTTLSLPAEEHSGTCLHCGACAAACPGACLPEAGRATCVSALSQQKKPLSPEEERLVLQSGLVWGCDRCQEVCPMNRRRTAEPHPCFAWYAPWVTADTIEPLEGKAYAWRGRAVIERNIRLWEQHRG